MPRLTDDGSEVRFAASGRAVVSAGPELPHAAARVIDGAFGTPRVMLELAPPRGAPAVAVYAAGHVLSGNPPRPDVRYRIEASTDGDKNRLTIADRPYPRRGEEPADFWSQSLSAGSLDLPEPARGSVRVRFSNTGGKTYARAEMHLVYEVPRTDATRVTFAWTDDRGRREASHTVAASPTESTWTVPTGRGVRTRWVEFEPVAER